jgi:hypothetical protein
MRTNVVRSRVRILGQRTIRVCQLLCPPYKHLGTSAHRQPHETITTKLFCFSGSIENRRVVLSGMPALGAGGPGFKSGRPDQNILRLSEGPFTQSLHCGILPDRRSRVTSRLRCTATCRNSTRPVCPRLRQAPFYEHRFPLFCRTSASSWAGAESVRLP